MAASCPQGTAYNDGCASAPPGTPQYPHLFSSGPGGYSYAVRPPWNVAGVDYYVGVPSDVKLKDPTVAGALPSCASYSADSHYVTVKASNCTLYGFNFGSQGGMKIAIPGGIVNTRIQSSYFSVGPGTPASNVIWPGYGALVEAASGSGNLYMRNITVNGSGPSGRNLGAILSYSGNGRVVVQYMYAHDLDADAFDINTGNVTDDLYSHNLIVNLGMTQGAHPDLIQYCGTLDRGGKVSYTTNFNTPGSTVGDNELLSWEAQSCGDQSTSMLQDVGFSNNVVLAPGNQAASGSNNGSSQTASLNIGTFQDAGQFLLHYAITNNYIDYKGAYAPFSAPVGSSSNWTYSGNVNINTGHECAPSSSGTCN